MKRVPNFRVVEGDPNEVDKNEILPVRDNSTGKVKSIREREGAMVLWKNLFQMTTYIVELSLGQLT